MKIKTTNFNSGNLLQLFMKISTHRNHPLYGMSHITFPQVTS